LNYFDFLYEIVRKGGTAVYNETVKGNVINTALKASLPPEGQKGRVGDVCRIHYHDELEFLAVYDGVFGCTVYDKEYIAKAGDVIFINSRVPHSTRNVEPARVGLVQFKESDFVDTEITKIIKYSMRFQSQVSSPIRIFHSEELFDALDLILKEVDEKKNSYEIFVRSGAYRVLGFLYREGVLSDSERIYNTREVQKVLPILSYINNFYQENLTLESVSSKLGFDQSYFCRIFKTATGATFTEYLNFVRICKAEKLLLKSRESILEISETVGFSSVSYFNRIFKKYRNCSPRTYRSVICCRM
jgi:AraC-like DNA-binding protein/mannose-6-phosphate isomerase-like protein (cupin superfamily)